MSISSSEKPVSKRLVKPSLQCYFQKKISPDNLHELLNVTGHLPTTKELDSWIKEFEKEGLLSEKGLTEAFKLYDEDGSGEIMRKELKKIISLVDAEMTDSEIEELIREADIDGDGTIDYTEFV